MSQKYVSPSFCLTLLTDIMLVVRVPVLSEQMTDVQPSVSTEGKLRTIAFFFAILRVPEQELIGIEPLVRGPNLHSCESSQLTESQAGGDDSRQAFWDGSHS